MHHVDRVPHLGGGAGDVLEHRTVVAPEAVSQSILRPLGDLRRFAESVELLPKLDCVNKWAFASDEWSEPCDGGIIQRDDAPPGSLGDS